MITLTPTQIKHDQLAQAITKCISDDGDVRDLLAELNLLPSTQAIALAGQSALLTLLAHNLSYQTVDVPAAARHHNGHKPPRKKKAGLGSGRTYRCNKCSAGPWPTYAEQIAHKKEAHP